MKESQKQAKSMITMTYQRKNKTKIAFINSENSMLLQLEKIIRKYFKSDIRSKDSIICKLMPENKPILSNQEFAKSLLSSNIHYSFEVVKKVKQNCTQHMQMVESNKSFSNILSKSQNLMNDSNSCSCSNSSSNSDLQQQKPNLNELQMSQITKNVKYELKGQQCSQCQMDLQQWPIFYCLICDNQKYICKHCEQKQYLLSHPIKNHTFAKIKSGLQIIKKVKVLTRWLEVKENREKQIGKQTENINLEKMEMLVGVMASKPQQQMNFLLNCNQFQQNLFTNNLSSEYQQLNVIIQQLNMKERQNKFKRLMKRFKLSPQQVKVYDEGIYNKLSYEQVYDILTEKKRITQK